MRKVNYKNKHYNGIRSRKKNAMLIAIAIILLIVVFFLSFIVAYNIMSGDKDKSLNNDIDNLSDLSSTDSKQQSDLPTDVVELQAQIEALNQEIEDLNAQIEKYKALAEMKSGNIPAATRKPVESSTPTPKPAKSSSPKPTQAPSATPPATETPKPAATPKPVETQTPVPTLNDGTLDGI